MANKKRRLRLTPVEEKKTLWSTVKEMFSIGRKEEETLYATKGKYNLYTAKPTLDTSKSDYALSKAIFYASEVKDKDDKLVGSKYLLGAGFGKPIINTSAAFALPEPPRVSITPEKDEITDEENNTEFEINDFLQNNHSKLFKFARNAFRDGDSYFRIYSTDKVQIISPDRVEKIIDPITGELQGYDITSVTKEGDAENPTNIKYREELRMKSPFRRVFKITDNDESELTQYSETVGEEDEDFRPLPIVHFANEQEDDMKYGVSDYQSALIFMANYSSVLENAIKNNEYNGSAVPVFEGIENLKQFLALNFDLNEEGEYDINWDREKLIVGGKGFKAEIIEGIDSTPGAERLLKILFYLICQTSETPEFVMGTAVQSSKASVSEQLPVLIKKAKRKQTQMEDVFKEIIRLFVYRLINENESGYVKDYSSLNFTIKWPSIVDDDMQLNLKIVQLLSDLGAISKETAINLLNPNGIISDPEAEIAQANDEAKETAKNNPLSGLGGNQNPEDELQQTQEMEELHKRIDDTEVKLEKAVQIIREMKGKDND